MSISYGRTTSSHPSTVSSSFRYKEVAAWLLRGFEVFAPRGGALVAASRASEKRFCRKDSVEIRWHESSVLAAPTRRYHRRHRHRCRSRRRFRIRHRDATASSGGSLDAFSMRRVSAANLSPGTLCFCFPHVFCVVTPGFRLCWWRTYHSSYNWSAVVSAHSLRTFTAPHGIAIQIV